MIFLLLLPVLTAGYFTAVYHPYFRLSSAREEGQRLYLRVVSLGFTSLAVGGALTLTLSVVMPNEFDLCVYERSNSIPTHHTISLDLDTALSQALIGSGMLQQSSGRQSAWLIILSAATFVGAVIVVLQAYIRYGLRAKVFDKANWPTDNAEFQKRPLRTWFVLSKQSIKLDITAELLEQSPMDRALFQAQMTGDPLQFWMKNRKMYVGWVLDTAEPMSTPGSSSEVTILPMMSGYQDEHDLRVTFTTFYLENNQRVELILRQDEILTASPFDLDTFDALNPGTQVSQNDSEQIT